MPTRTKAATSLLGMVGSDDEQDNVDLATAGDFSQENHHPSATVKTATKTRVTRKTKPASRRLSAGKSKVTAARKTAKRAPLKAQNNASNDEEVAEPGNDAIEDDTTSAVASTKRSETIKDPPKRKGRPPKKAPQIEIEEAPALTTQTSVLKDGEFEYTPTRALQTSKSRVRAKKSAPKQAPAPAEPPFPASQLENELMELDVNAPPSSPLSLHSSADLDLDLPFTEAAARSTVHSSSFQPQPWAAIIGTSNPRKRTHSVASAGSNTDSDPNLRRKLGDITNKYAALETRYRNLREVGIKEAEANFERLKKTTDERHRIANELIASLRKEVATHRAAAAYAKEEMETLDEVKADLAQAKVDLEEKKAEATECRAENQALQARLAASRSAAIGSLSANEAKTPGSAVKRTGRAGAAATADHAGGSHAGSGAVVPTRTIMVGSAEAAAAAQVAQLKEELYGDLTGLIIRGVDRGQEEMEVYDCIQTGRNGSESSVLRFILSLASLMSTMTNGCWLSSAPLQTRPFHRSVAQLRRDRVQLHAAAGRWEG